LGCFDHLRAVLNSGDWLGERLRLFVAGFERFWIWRGPNAALLIAPARPVEVIRL